MPWDPNSNFSGARCKLELNKTNLGVIGAPCILFSAWAAKIGQDVSFFSCTVFTLKLFTILREYIELQAFDRYGKREGFQTKKTAVKHAHDVSIRMQQVTSISVHENVPDYDEDWSQYITCGCK